MTSLPTITVRQTVALPIGSAGTLADFVSFDGFDPTHEHFAVIFPRTNLAAPLVRVHSECVTGDVFGSRRCDCGAQLIEAIERCTKVGGIIIYLRQEGRGIGFNAKLDAYRLQNEGLNTYEANRQSGYPADARNFDAAVAILHALEIKTCRLLTNNPAKVDALSKGGITLTEIVPTAVHITAENEKYLHDKAEFAGHRLDFSRLD